MPRRILIIDDDEDILEILSYVFQDEGYNVITANNGDAANHILEYSPDLLLLDVRLVGSSKSGTDICRELKAMSETSHLPVILVSAEHDLAYLASQCGADAYVNKPFEFKHLLESVSRKLR